MARRIRQHQSSWSGHHRLRYRWSSPRHRHRVRASSGLHRHTNGETGGMYRSRAAGSPNEEISGGRRGIGTTTGIDTRGTRVAGNAVSTTTAIMMATTTMGTTAGTTTAIATTGIMMATTIGGGITTETRTAITASNVRRSRAKPVRPNARRSVPAFGTGTLTGRRGVGHRRHIRGNAANRWLIQHAPGPLSAMMNGRG